MESMKGKISFKEMKETKRHRNPKTKQPIAHLLFVLLAMMVLIVLPVNAMSATDYEDVEAPKARIIIDPDIIDDAFTDAEGKEETNPERVDSEESEEKISTMTLELTGAESPVEDTIYRYDCTDEEYNILCRVVEAEVTGYEIWVEKGLSHDDIINAKARVAQVFLNRVENQKFDANTLKSALLARNATSTLIDGRYYTVSVTEHTREAVDKALSIYTPDMTQGATYFSSGKANRPTSHVLFKDSVGHIFAY